MQNAFFLNEVMRGRISLKEVRDEIGGQFFEIWKVDRCELTNRKVLSARVALRATDGTVIDPNVPSLATLPTYCDEPTLGRYVRLLRLSL